MWVFRFPDVLNVLSHSGHLTGFSPLWILLWITRWAEYVNCLPQTVHSNGFSPEWLRLCTVNSLLFAKHFRHSVHMYKLPLWTFKCCFKCFKSLKLFLTLTAWIQLSCSMYFYVIIQIAFCHKPFVTHCTQMWSCLVIMWMLSDIITISFKSSPQQNFHLYNTQNIQCYYSERKLSLVRKLMIFINENWN